MPDGGTRFGLFTRFPRRQGISQPQAFDEFFELVQTTEELGYETIWLGEEHFDPDLWLSSSNITLAAAAAAMTTRLRIGLAIVALPLSHPLRVAEAVATVDQISRGRLDFGAGRSSSVEVYRRSGVSYLESKARQLEGLEVIKKAWTQERFTHKGKYYDFPDVSLSPGPYQKPHPPISIAALSPESFAEAGRLGYDLFVFPRGERSKLRERFDEYHSAWEEAGHPGRGKIVASFLVYVAETEERAYSEPEEGTMGLFELQARLLAPFEELGEEANQARVEQSRYLATASYEEHVRDDVIVQYGTPESVAESLLELRDDLGLSGFMVEMNCFNRLSHELTLESMRLFSERVMPRFG